MSTNAFPTILIGTSLLAFSAIAGCDANDDRASYAEQPTRPADGSLAGDTADPRSMDPAVASERPAAQPGSDPMTRSDGMSADGMGTLSAAAQAEVIGKPVLSPDGEEIGRIASIVADGNGESEFAVVEVGEFLGIGEKQVAIDVRQLRLTADGQIQSDVTADTLQSMPEYEAADYEQEMEEEDVE